jgi:hypothetical protein
MKRRKNRSREDGARREGGVREVRQFALSVEYSTEAGASAPALIEESLGRLVEAFMFPNGEGPRRLDEESAPEEMVSFLVCLLRDVGTGLWRMRERMVEPQGGEPLPEMRRAYRHLEALMDTLTQMGVRIHGHTDEQVPACGIYALKAVAYEPTPGLVCERVIETIKPTIYFGSQVIQVGEVVIGTPLASG